MEHFYYSELIDSSGRNMLAVDILPAKTCDLDCVFCPLGPTVNCTVRQINFGNVTDRALSDLRNRLREVKPDIVTILSKGEPTFNMEFGKVIETIHDEGYPVQLFSNGYSLMYPEIRRFANKCEEVVGELRVTSQEQFERLQRPVDPSVTFGDYIINMKEFRDQFPGKFIVEVTVLAGHNDDDESIEKLKLLLKFIHPTEVSLITAFDQYGDLMKGFGLPEEKFDGIVDRIKNKLRECETGSRA